MVIDDSGNILDRQLSQPGRRGHEREPPEACLDGQWHPDCLDPFLVLVDDHLDLPSVAHVGGCTVLLDRPDTFQQTGAELCAVGESPPFRVDVLMDAVPADRQIRLVYVHVLSGIDGQRIRAAPIRVDRRTAGVAAAECMARGNSRAFSRQPRIGWQGAPRHLAKSLLRRAWCSQGRRRSCSRGRT
jgi:hypothetical protein